MSRNAASKFRAIQDFPELVEYLADELDWPIDTDDFEEMTFEYSAAELGLDDKTAPKFIDIRRLRPLDKDQPWGVFFIRLDDRKLPVVALRRLLSKLVVKKRSTSNSGDRGSWHENDILLISQTGSLETRSISFAHFATNPEKTDLPILKVLGWDDDDTGLKVDYVIETLREKLIWPDDPTNSDAWRAQWRDAFTLKHREVIQNSKEMAERLGQLALAVRTRLREVLAIESDEDPIHKLMSVFKENLISDLDTDSFSDMYAQTIAYGLLSARIINPKANTADAARTQIPITNPFLRDLMETFLNVGGRNPNSGLGLDFDELGINEVVDLLDNTNMEAVLRDFGDRNQKEDPVMHFFEGFLKEYDSKIRKDRGVFYTPQPVVSFIVRSVDEQLRTEFGLEDGLADTTTWGELAARITDLKIPEGTSPDQAFVQILDPATGTGTFPVEVIDLIYKTMTAKWQAQGNREAQIKELWNEYVPKHLLPRLHGYELMMAPYAIAHMKIGLKLYETGYRFKSNQRVLVYLTNALEPAQEFSDRFAFAIPALAREAKSANQIKLDKRFTVVIGNPPYANFGRLNRIPFILDLLEDYKRDLGEKKINLNDDFIKFLRLSQHIIKNSGVGVHGMITNNVYFNGITHRGLRASLQSELPLINILDLHGNVSAKERALDGSPDENVFDIKQGVGIGIMTKTPSNKHGVRFSELRGKRSDKYKSLIKGTVFKDKSKFFSPQSPYFFFVPKNFNTQDEYLSFTPLPSMFDIPSYGIQTKRDALTITLSRDEIIQHGEDTIHLSENALKQKYQLKDDGRDWKVKLARADLERLPNLTSALQQVLYRPFDIRWTIYTDRSKGFLGYPRWGTMSCMLDNNIALIAMRQVFLDGDLYSHFGVTRLLIDERTFYSNRGGTYLFPLYKSEVETDQCRMFGNVSRQTNFTKEFLENVSGRLGVPIDKDNNLPLGLSAEDIFFYGYAVFSSIEYRKRYAEHLKVDFPRLPLTGNQNLFVSLARLGSELATFHLLESPDLGIHINTITNSEELQVEKVSFSDATIWVNKDKTKGFGGIPEEIWNFQLGGYQVCQKWLKDRGPKKGQPGRILTKEDIDHYKNIIFAISETIRIMVEIDEVIDAHGGWPDAFITADT